MLFGQKLSGLGLAIYFSGILLAVIALVYIEVNYKELNKAISFCIFAGIWLAAYLFAILFKKKK